LNESLQQQVQKSNRKPGSEQTTKISVRTSESAAAAAASSAQKGDQ
jgi:hypothetical protein